MKKLIFKLIPRIHVFLYRLTGGKMGSEMKGLKILLLTTTGRKSGKKRTMPLAYFDYDGGYTITASNGGQPNNPAWFYNLNSKPQAAVQVKGAKMAVVAEQATGELRGQLWSQLIEQAPTFADYEKSTTREIPMLILRPTNN